MNHLACVECGSRINYRQPGVGQYVTGIRQNRAAGGANQIIDMRPTDRWLCRTCTDSHRMSAQLQPGKQPGLFA